MDALMTLEIELIVFLQSIGQWLIEPMRFLSMLGTENTYLIVMPLLYWCVDASLGLRVGLMLLLTNSLNSYLKLAFHSPRPYWVSSQVQAWSVETSFGVPSGHAQNAAAVWGLLAHGLWQRWRRPWTIWTALILIFLIGFSRLYLGMHFFRDVLAGWLIGGLLVWAFVRLTEPVGGWLRQRSTAQLVGLAVLSSLALIGIQLGVRAALGEWELPPSWQETAGLGQPDDPIDPLSVSGTITAAGTWLGMTAGAAVYFRRKGMYRSDGTAGQKALRYGIGMVGLLAIYLGLKLVLPEEPALLESILRFARYTLVGLWVSIGAPLIFDRLGLSGRSLAEIPVQSTIA
jgi:membrane-associated phospholipid phosphatase